MSSKKAKKQAQLTAILRQQPKRSVKSLRKTITKGKDVETETKKVVSKARRHTRQAKREAREAEVEVLEGELPEVDRDDLTYWDKHSDREVLLRKFDLDPAFGPCIGLSRKQRWLRARKLGLEPPQYVWLLLNDGKEQAEQHALWDQNADDEGN